MHSSLFTVLHPGVTFFGHKSLVTFSWSHVDHSSHAQVQALFDRSMHDARVGFRIALTMDAVLFTFGILMLAACGALAIAHNSVDSWWVADMLDTMEDPFKLERLLVGLSRGVIRCSGCTAPSLVWREQNDVKGGWASRNEVPALTPGGTLQS